MTFINPVTVNTQTAIMSATDMSTEAEDAASSDQQPATSTSASDSTLTIGEMVEKHLNIKKIGKKKSRVYVCLLQTSLCHHVFVLMFLFFFSLSVCLKMITCLSPKVGSLISVA